MSTLGPTGSPPQNLTDPIIMGMLAETIASYNTMKTAAFRYIGEWEGNVSVDQLHDTDGNIAQSAFSVHIGSTEECSLIASYPGVLYIVSAKLIWS